ncbi:unnamed protein product [Durusdinium trenchii]|uniref:Uncharacterized protein n=1 Tax=Durusdinium trenchii TaxID=1381693 RepID=A0ABP0HMH7_9DINO
MSGSSPGISPGLGLSFSPQVAADGSRRSDRRLSEDILRGGSILSVEEVDEDRFRRMTDLPNMSDIHAWMQQMQLSMKRIESSLSSQHDIMEDVRSKVWALSKGKSFGKPISRKNSPDPATASSPSKTLSSLGVKPTHSRARAESGSDFQGPVPSMLTNSLEEAPSVPGQASTPLQGGSMVPGRDLSVDEVHSREQPHFSTKSLGVSNYGYREKASSSTRRKSDPGDLSERDRQEREPKTSLSGFDKGRLNFLRSSNEWDWFR